MSRLIDLSGQRFGRLLVIERDTSKSPKERKYRTLWKCKCDCGKEVVVWANNLVRGHTLSCGCYKIETFIGRETEHGMSDTRLYEIWKGMRRRCLDPKRNSYHNYGGRGIVVCADWENDFGAFQKWAVENGYKDGLTVDRKNNDGPYSPENCKWASIKEQANNRRTNRYIDVFGEHLTISEAAQKYGIKPCTIRARIEHGWMPERAVSIILGETVKMDQIIGGAE